MFGKESGELRFDPVDGCDQEVRRAHRQVSDPEVEERFRGASIVALPEQVADPGQVGIDGGFERGVQQVLDSELLGEVGAGGLALPGLVVDVDLSLRDDHVVARAGRKIGPLLSTARSVWLMDRSDSSSPS